MKKSYHLHVGGTVSKKCILLSVLTLFIIFAALASMTAVINAQVVVDGEIPYGILIVAPDVDCDPYTHPNDEDWVAVEETFDVLPCHCYWIVIWDIPEELGDPGYALKPILVDIENDGMGWREGWVHWDGDSELYYLTLLWHCPEAEYCTTYRVLYKDMPDLGPDTVVSNLDSQQVYVAMGTLQSIARLHVIPEFAFGTVTAILSSLSGLTLFSKFRRK